jgi:hypothetical protein
MILVSNNEELKKMVAYFSFVSTETKKITMFTFIKKSMSKIYRLIHNAVFPRVLEEMKNKLQFDQ